MTESTLSEINYNTFGLSSNRFEPRTRWRTIVKSSKITSRITSIWPERIV